MNSRLDIKIELTASDIKLHTMDVDEPTLYIRDFETGAVVDCPNWLTITDTQDEITIKQTGAGTNFKMDFGGEMVDKVMDIVKGVMKGSKPRGINHWNFNNESRVKLEMVLPAEQRLDRVRLRTTTGDIEAVGIQARKRIRLASLSGDIVAVDLAASRIKADNKSGDIKLVDFISKKVTADNVSGDVLLTGSQDELRADSVSGDVEIKSGNLIGAGSFSTVSGDIRLRVENPSNQNYTLSCVTSTIRTVHGNGPKHKSYLNGTSGAPIKVTTVSGDFSLS